VEFANALGNILEQILLGFKQAGATLIKTASHQI